MMGYIKTKTNEPERVGQKPGKEHTMKYTVTMNKTEITKIVTTANTIIGSLSKLYDAPDAKEVLDMIGGAEALKNDIEEIEKMFKEHKNGGIGNEHYSVEVKFNGDAVTTTVIISDELIVECMNIFTKIFISSYYYIGAFFKDHAEELEDLSELIIKKATKAVGDDINHMFNRFNFADLLNSAWGCFVPKKEEASEEEEKNDDQIIDKKMSKEELHKLLCDEVKESLGE